MFFQIMMKLSFFRAARKTKSMEDFLASAGGSLPVHDRAGLRLSAVKALVLREKEDRLNLNDDEKVLYLINSLFDQGI